MIRTVLGFAVETVLVRATVRKNFADTALWAPALTTNQDGVAEVALTMPENLTGWKVKVWAMGHGTRVGQGEAEVVTKKDLLVRLQAPRFFVQKDEVVLSANVHNYLKAEKLVDMTLELGGPLSSATPARQQVRVPASSDRRVDWRVKVQAEGTAVVRMKAVSDEESDAMEVRFPCLVVELPVLRMIACVPVVVVVRVIVRQGRRRSCGQRQRRGR